MYEKLELLPVNQLLIINKLLENENIVKVLSYNSSNPSPLLSPLPSEENIQKLFLTRILPYPFSDDITNEQSQIRVYYPMCEFVNGGHIQMTEIYFDIIVHKKLILMKEADNKTTTFRTEFLGKEIISQFNEKSIGTIGELKFKRRTQVPINSEFIMIKLVADTMM